MSEQSGKKQTMRLALTAVLTAVTVVFTILVRIPTPLKGYINLGDVAICFTAFTFGPVPAFIAGGLGTALADLLSGYAQWAPVSFLSHGLQGLIIGLMVKKQFSSGERPSWLKLVLSVVVGSIIMAGGYFMYSIVLFGFSPSLVDVPLNLLQAAVGGGVGYAISHGVRKAYPPVQDLSW